MMEKKQKKILIIGLIAAVLLLSVAYAAFATQLNINGTANIVSRWDVRFDNTKNENNGAVVATPGKLVGGADGIMPSGTITYPTAYNDLKANLTADLKQPGDTVEFTLTIKNNGTLRAKPGNPILSLPGADSIDQSGLVAIKGHIQFTVEKPTLTLPENGTDTMKVTAEFIDTTPAEEAHCSNEQYSEEQACTNAGGQWIPATDGVTPSLLTMETAVLGVTVTYTQA